MGETLKADCYRHPDKKAVWYANVPTREWYCDVTSQIKPVCLDCLYEIAHGEGAAEATAEIT